jgi:hypothetical protein
MALRAHERKSQPLSMGPRGVYVQVERGGLADQWTPKGAISLDGEVRERLHE